MRKITRGWSGLPLFLKAVLIWLVCFGVLLAVCAANNVSAMHLLEQFGWSPDGGDGSTERDVYGASLVVIAAVSAVPVGAITSVIAGIRSHQRRNAQTAGE